MKQLTCEMCGSTDLIKQEGVFVCQNCGTKYSVEEAKKMMIEGSVQVDSSHLTGNYLAMAKNALDASNNTEADNYCNKIIEVDPKNWEAWFIKGKAVGWASTLGNPRITETINAFSNALENCPEEEKEKLSKQCKEEIENLHKALLTLRMQNFMNHPGQYDLAGLNGDVQSIIVNTVNFLVKAGISADTFGKDLGSIIINAVKGGYHKILSDYKGSENKPGDYEFKRYIEETDYCINALQLATTLLGSDDTDDLSLYELRASTYDAMVRYNTQVRDACSWDYNFNDWGGKNYYKNLTLTSSAVSLRNSNNEKWKKEAQKWRNKKKSKEEAAAKKRFNAYWEAHADLKKELESQKSEFEDKIKSLNKEKREQVNELQKTKDAITGGEKVDALEANIQQLKQEKATLGIFKGKEKQALQDKINQLTAEMNAIQGRINDEKEAIQAEIDKIEEEFDKKIAPFQKKVDSIKTELTKSR